jgi:murein DD-endopeptidase MepM/ murein hydrolase activator NlpD
MMKQRIRNKFQKTFQPTLTFVFILWAIILVLSSSIPALAGNTEAAPTPTPLPNPLSSPLPSPDPIPIPAWRPPLYPVPWSLSQNDHFFFLRPIAADEVNWPLPDYRYGGTFFSDDLPHTGVDIVTPIGTPVLAAAAGQVSWIGYGLYQGIYDEDDPYGLAIGILHDFGYNNKQLYTIYAHLSNILVTKGQSVETGDIIGLSGDTGFATAPHLHFEVRNGTNNYFNTVNPELWLSPPQGWGVLVGQVTSSWGVLLNNQEVQVINLDLNQYWYAKTYSTDLTINPDQYYKENFVLSDLPAGRYRILIPYVGNWFHTFVQIYPGAVTYFNFRGYYHFRNTLPKPIPPNNLPIE